MFVFVSCELVGGEFSLSESEYKESKLKRWQSARERKFWAPKTQSNLIWPSMNFHHPCLMNEQLFVIVSSGQI